MRRQPGRKVDDDKNQHSNDTGYIISTPNISIVALQPVREHLLSIKRQTECLSHLTVRHRTAFTPDNFVLALLGTQNDIPAITFLAAIFLVMKQIALFDFPIKSTSRYLDLPRYRSINISPAGLPLESKSGHVCKVSDSRQRFPDSISQAKPC